MVKYYGQVFGTHCLGLPGRGRDFFLATMFGPALGATQWVLGVTWEIYAKFLVGKPQGKRTLGRLRRRCKDNIKTDIRETGCEVWAELNWIRIVSNGGLPLAQ
jgi:hypothetical protein